MNGSNMQSPFFMMDPIESSSSDILMAKMSLSKEPQTETESEDLTPKESTDGNSGEDDVFVVESNQGTYHLHRSALKECLSSLKPYAEVYINKLPVELNDSFKSILETLKLLHGSKAYYDVVLKDIQDIFVKNVKRIKPGTVAAFFAGCFNDDGLSGPNGCHLKCAMALHGIPSEDINKDFISVCEDLVLIYNNGNFGSINEKQSAFAYIYVDAKDFHGFTKKNIETLKSSGIYDVALIFGNEDGTYKEVGTSISVHDLPLKSKSSKKSGKKTGKNDDNGNGDNNNSDNSGIWIVIVVAVVILLLLFLVYRQSYFL
jgi:hypothetical protein